MARIGRSKSDVCLDDNKQHYRRGMMDVLTCPFSPSPEISTTIFHDSRRIAIYSQSEEEILFKILARIFDFFQSSHEQRRNALFSPLRVSRAGGGQPCFLNYLNRDKSSVVVRLSSSQKSALHAHALQATRLQQGIPRFLSSLCFSFSFFPLRASLLSVQAERAS